MSRFRNFFCTKNNYTEEYLTMLQNVECRYIAYTQEVAPTTNMEHVHFYISFQNNRTLAAMRKSFPSTDIRVQRGSFQDCEDYVTKKTGGTLDYERGTCPMSNDNQIKSQKERFAEALVLAKDGRLDDIDPELLTRYNAFYRKTAERHGKDPDGGLDVPDRDELINYWVYGPTGTGKTRGVISEHGKENVFKVGISDKFWSLYYEQPILLIDDMTPYDIKFTKQLLNVSDHYSFAIEKKGTDHRMVRPKIVYVTSNFTPDEIWATQPATLAAIKRRFTMVHKPGDTPEQKGHQLTGWMISQDRQIY